MQQAIETIRQEFDQEITAVTNTDQLETIKVKYLGRKGPVQNLMKLLKDATSEERPLVGKYINDLKEEITARINTTENHLILKEESAQLANEKLDISLPGKRRLMGRKHIITQAMDKMIDILMGMGFTVQYGPDIDSDYYNFEALNFSQDHPARDMQDTFYITPNILLRTQTSNIQARIMETTKPPIRIISPGKAYRNETVSARSHVFFHQIEGIYVDSDVTFADLLATLDEFFAKLFQRKIETRYRPSYFPFVEPGMEVDISCLACSGTGCQLCKYTGWLEVAGAGMVHPEVLRNVDIDPEVYSGYAWGLGVERLIMLLNGIDDIRRFTENDLRFLKQF